MMTMQSSRLVRLMTIAGVCALSLAASGEAKADPKADSSCVACHSDQKWLVQNKKIYDYWQNWQVSVHNEEGVTCTDCHSGNDKARDKGAAHAARSANAVSFQNIPKTCASCHSTIYEAYSKSSHAASLSGNKALQGPSCVTCHGSVNAAVISAGTVKEVCSTCHNAKTKNHTEIPERAAYILTRFLSIQRLYRYVSLKGDPQSSKSFFETIDPIRSELTYEWHTFDLDKAEGKTRLLLDSLKKERDRVRTSKKTD